MQYYVTGYPLATILPLTAQAASDRMLITLAHVAIRLGLQQTTQHNIVP